MQICNLNNCVLEAIDWLEYRIAVSNVGRKPRANKRAYNCVCTDYGVEMLRFRSHVLEQQKTIDKAVLQMSCSIFMSEKHVFTDLRVMCWLSVLCAIAACQHICRKVHACPSAHNPFCTTTAQEWGFSSVSQATLPFASNANSIDTLHVGAHL